jgi:hypothetical protein
MLLLLLLLPLSDVEKGIAETAIRVYPIARVIQLDNNSGERLSSHYNYGWGFNASRARRISA